MLNLSQVQTFLAIVDEGSFQAAAQRLNCSQPTISQQLRKLEEHLGVQLIGRNRARSTPTRDGEAFLPFARSLVSSADRVRERMQRRKLVIAASSNIGVFLAPRLIAEFKNARYPDLELTLEIGTNRSVIDAVQFGEADVGLTEWSEELPGYEWRPWRRERLIVIASPDSPLARGKRVGKSQLLQHPMLGGEPGTGTGRILREFFGDDAARLKSGMQLGSTAAVKEAVKARLGVSIVLEYAVAEDVAFGSLAAIEIEEADLYKHLYVVIADEAPQSSLARQFTAFLCGDSA